MQAAVRCRGRGQWGGGWRLAVQSVCLMAAAFDPERACDRENSLPKSSRSTLKLSRKRRTARASRLKQQLRSHLCFWADVFQGPDGTADEGTKTQPKREPMKVHVLAGK